MNQPSSIHLLKTPYYKDVDTTPEIIEDGYNEELKGNYSSYELFCLKTRLFIYLNRGEDIQFRRVNLENRMVVTVNIIDGSNDVNLNNVRFRELQDMINVICDDSTSSINEKKIPYCLIYTPSRYSDIPLEYQRIILPLIVSEKYSMTVIDDQVYGRLPGESEAENYLEIHSQLNVDMFTMLGRYYEMGYIPCSSEFTKKWNLVEREKGLCSPKWNYPSFIKNKIEFLIDRFLERPLYISVPQDERFYHAICMYIQPLTIIGGSLCLYPNSIEEVRDIFTTVDFVRNSKYEELVVETTQLPVKPESIPKSCVVYTIDDTLFPIVLSCET